MSPNRIDKPLIIFLKFKKMKRASDKRRRMCIEVLLPDNSHDIEILEVDGDPRWVEKDSYCNITGDNRILAICTGIELMRRDNVRQAILNPGIFHTGWFFNEEIPLAEFFYSMVPAGGIFLFMEILSDAQGNPSVRFSGYNDNMPPGERPWYYLTADINDLYDAFQTFVKRCNVQLHASLSLATLPPPETLFGLNAPSQYKRAGDQERKYAQKMLHRHQNNVNK